MKVPTELTAVPRWVAWKPVRDDKKPVCCGTGGPAKVNDPATWTDFETARDYARRHRLGLGFVFSQDDDICGVDLDDCRDPASGRLLLWAEVIVDLLNSYTEVSPSRTGVKVFLRGRLAGGKNWNRGGVEAYGHAKFFAVTGAHVKGTPPTVEARQAELDVLAEDEEILRKARRADNRDKFNRLMAGVITDYQSDDSAADFALCVMLKHWAGPDATRIERLFARSKLAERDKWRSRPDYRERTIAAAIQAGGCELGRDRKREDIKLNTHADGPSLGEQAIPLAEALAEAEGDGLDWQVMFKLARKVQKALAGEGGCGPEPFEHTIIAFCRRANIPEDKYEHYWLVFQECWHKVKLAEGENPNDWAVEMARRFPVVLPPTPLMKTYALVGSAAYYLADLRKPEPFWFDGERIAGVLGTHHSTIYRVIPLLERNGVIRCVDRRYDYNAGLARKYDYTGPHPIREAA